MDEKLGTRSVDVDDHQLRQGQEKRDRRMNRGAVVVVMTLVKVRAEVHKLLTICSMPPPNVNGNVSVKLSRTETDLEMWMATRTERTR